MIETIINGYQPVQSTLIPILLVSLIVFSFVAIGLSVNKSHKWDESVWAYISQQWLGGTPPYSRGTKDVKPPIVYLLGAITFSILPKDIRSFRFISTVAFGISILLVFLLGFELTGDIILSLFSAAFYTISPLVLREHIEVRAEALSHVFSLAAIYCLILGQYFMAGLLCGIALLSKQSALVTAGTLSIYLLYSVELLGFAIFLLASVIVFGVSMAYFAMVGNLKSYMTFVFLEIIRSTSHDPDRLSKLYSGARYFRVMAIGIAIFFVHTLVEGELHLLSLYLALYILAFVIMAGESFFKHYLIDISGPAALGTMLALQSFSHSTLLLIISMVLLLNIKRYIMIFTEANPERTINFADRVKSSHAYNIQPFKSLLSFRGGIDRIREYVNPQLSAVAEERLAAEMKPHLQNQIVFSNTAIWLFIHNLQSGYDFPFYGLRARNRGTLHQDVDTYIIDTRHDSPGNQTYPLSDRATIVFEKDGVQIYHE